MTRLLDDPVSAVSNMPPEAQDAIARVVLRPVGTDDEAPPVTLSPGERTSTAASRAAAARGEFATDEQARAVWAKYGV
jgi:hypothetical protein